MELNSAIPDRPISLVRVYAKEAQTRFKVTTKQELTQNKLFQGSPNAGKGMRLPSPDSTDPAVMLFVKPKSEPSLQPEHKPMPPLATLQAVIGIRLKDAFRRRKPLLNDFWMSPFKKMQSLGINP